MFLSEIRPIDGSVHTHTHTLTGSNFGKYVDAMALHFELHTKMPIKNKYSYFKKRVYPPYARRRKTTSFLYHVIPVKDGATYLAQTRKMEKLPN